MENKMINLRNLSQNAINILVKAGHLDLTSEYWENEDYVNLYKEFLAETGTTKSPCGFNKFNVAVVNAKRKKTLYFKEQGICEWDTVRKEVKETFGKYRNERWRFNYVR